MSLSRRFENAGLVLAIGVIAITYMLNPVLVRSLLDGFVPTQDEKGLLFGLSILALMEFTGLACSFLFRQTLDERVAAFIETNRLSLIDKVSRKRRLINRNELQLALTVTIPSLAHRVIRDPWQRGRDVAIVLLVSLAALSLNYACGFAILGMVILQALMALVVKGFSGRNLAATKEQESSLFNRWMSRLPHIWDRGASNEQLSALREEVDQVHSSLLSGNRLRSKLDDLGRLIRTLAVMATLWISIDSVNAGNITSGTLWALVILIYRINQPIASLIRVSFQEDRNRRDLTQWRFRLLRGDKPARIKLSKLSRILDQTQRSADQLHINCSANQLPELATLLRQWQSRVSPSAGICIIEKGLGADEIVPTARIYVLIGCLSGESIGQSSLYSRLKQSNPSARIWTLDSIPYGKPDVLIHYSLSNEIETAEIISNQNSLKLLNDWETLDFRFRDFRRDLRRYVRMGVPAVVLYCRQNASASAAAKLRQTDHYIPLPNGGFLLGLMGTEQSLVATACSRLEKQSPELSVLKTAECWLLEATAPGLPYEQRTERSGFTKLEQKLRETVLPEITKKPAPQEGVKAA